jgi:F-type H+-transporting ATPase subunit gamma
MRQRIRSVDNIAQVTRALQAISASRVRKAVQAVMATRPYATQAWAVLLHLSTQPARGIIHPLLTERADARSKLVILITGDRGLAGAYNTNVVRFTLEAFRASDVPVRFIVVGRKGRDMMVRRRMNILAEFSRLPAEPAFSDVSAIGRLAVEEFLEGRADQVFLIYTDYVNLLRQIPTMKKLLPLEMDETAGTVMELTRRSGPPQAYIYEPGETELIDLVVSRFTALQLYQAILESLASEHAARMVAMQNATQNANELSSILRLDYNKARQQAITNDMLDIVGGVEALG